MKIKKIKVHPKSTDTEKSILSFNPECEGAVITNKLVRDNIINKLHDRDAKYVYRTLESDNEYYMSLVDKFYEECSELLTYLELLREDFSIKKDLSTSNDLILKIRESICSESSDILEVLVSILKMLDISFEEFLNSYFEKRIENGSFNKRYYLSWYYEEPKEDKSDES